MTTPPKSPYREEDIKAVREWRSMDDVPKDGRWLILHVETGGDVYEPVVGRWNPQSFEGLGTYEYECVNRTPSFDAFVPADDVLNNYSEGRVYGWMELPT